MKFVLMRNKPSYMLACAAVCLLILAGCSSSDDASPVPDITVSGLITDFNDTPLSGVTVQGVYTSSTAENPSALTDSSGSFSLTLSGNTAFYLNGTFLGYTTINSEVLQSTVNIAGLGIGMPRGPEAEAIIDAAFPTEQLAIINHAWLAVDIEDENGNEVSGETITLSTAPSGFAYTNCDGTPSGGSTTIACLDRDGPAYIAYFDAAAEVTVTAVEQSKTAPLRMEQVTVLEYEIGPEFVTAFDRGAAYYDAFCTECHSAGSYDTDGFATNLLNTTIIQELSSYPSMGNVADLTVEQQADLQAFVTDPSLL
ncbi:MAG: carboxypeptidase-like regulatory domain-containing protein [Gammaproteobacteria bacterium]